MRGGKRSNWIAYALFVAILAIVFVFTFINFQSSSDLSENEVGGVTGFAQKGNRGGEIQTNFLPGNVVEAEKGVIVGSFATGKYKGANYVKGTQDNQGYVSFIFNIQNAGKYYLVTRVLAADSTSDSFYIGLDGLNTQNNENYAYAAINSNSFAWDNVSITGPGVFGFPYNPAVYDLSIGLHTLTFYGREAGALLDKVQLLEYPELTVCGNGVIESGEVCDDGNIISGDGCSSDCQIEIPLPVCGDSLCEEGETCSNCLIDCGECFSEYFNPNVVVEAENGEIVSQMATGISGSDTYVTTSQYGSGSVSYTFNIQTAGKYVMSGKVLAVDGGHDSFYLGVDGQNAQNDERYAYDLTPLSSTFVWANVSVRGLTGTFGDPDYNPAVYNLSNGLHTFTFYGREAGTWLDKIQLISYSGNAPIVPLTFGELSRSFSSNPASLNTEITVTLTKTLFPGETTLLTEEYIPTGFTLVNSGTGSVLGNTIRWVELSGAVSGTYVYTVRTPSVSGIKTFSGLYTLNGGPETPIRGSTQLTIG